MPIWLTIIILIAVLLVVYLLSAFILSLFLKRYDKKMTAELAKLLPYERERVNYLVSVKDSLLLDKKKISEELLELLRDNSSLCESVNPDVAKIKGQNDFLSIYFIKIIKDKNLHKKEEKYKDIVKRLESQLYDENKKDSPYKSYNKYAMRFNAIKSMTLVNLFIRRKNYKNATIF